MVSFYDWLICIWIWFYTKVQKITCKANIYPSPSFNTAVWKTIFHTLIFFKVKELYLMSRKLDVMMSWIHLAQNKNNDGLMMLRSRTEQWFTAWLWQWVSSFICITYLCHNEDVLSLEFAWGKPLLQSFPNSCFILVHVGCINMPVPQLQGNINCSSNFFRCRLKVKSNYEKLSPPTHPPSSSLCGSRKICWSISVLKLDYIHRWEVSKDITMIVTTVDVLCYYEVKN